MNPHPPHPPNSSKPGRHSVRRILSPGRRSIEVARQTGASEISQRPLHICGACASELVQPIKWRKAPADQWGLTLRCPNCACTVEGRYCQDQIEQLEERLDEGLTAMLNDLARLTQANLSDQMDRFAAALQADLILPQDF